MSDYLPVDPDALVTPHLTWGEATTTQSRDPDILFEQDNPPPAVRMALRRAAVDVFEPARDLVGPLLVTSGYRCRLLNVSIGGSRTSAHMDGRAFDVKPLELGLADAYRRIVASGIPFDQVIFEFGRWIHLGAAAHGAEPRRQALVIFGGGPYELYRPGDPRVRDRRLA